MREDPRSPAPRQTGPGVWLGSELQHEPGSWTWTFSDCQVDELLAAARRFQGAHDHELARMTPEDFPLPSMGAEVVGLRARLLHGVGFALLRGFPAAVDESLGAAAFVGLGVHLGAPRSQNAAGDLLGHVRNVGRRADDPTTRIYQTDQRQTFHTDSADVVGLMCLETAASGGQSLLVSAAAIYNEMLDRDPRLAATLFESVATDWRGEEPPGAAPYFSIPVLSWFEDHLTVLYQRQYIESAQRFEDVSPLTDEMHAALDLFDTVANDPRFYLAMDLEPGDMQFVHNHRLLHDRTAFVDRPGRPRHLLRLWLSMVGDRPLPPSFAERYGSIEIGNRGGIPARSG